TRWWSLRWAASAREPGWSSTRSLSHAENSSSCPASRIVRFRSWFTMPSRTMVWPSWFPRRKKGAIAGRSAGPADPGRRGSVAALDGLVHAEGNRPAGGVPGRGKRLFLIDGGSARTVSPALVVHADIAGG